MDTITTAWARAASLKHRAPPRVEPIQMPWTPRKLAFKVRNVLSPEQCKALIRAVEATGAYSPALVNNGRNKVLDKTTRDSSRCMVSHPTLANVLFQRAVVPIAQALATRKRPTEVNELLRFLKYERGQRFDQHHDNPYVRPRNHPKAGERSRFTILLYLTEGYDGGCTRFYSGWYGDRTETYDVLPETGMAIVHEHDILHAGTPVLSGTKFSELTRIVLLDRSGITYGIPQKC